MSSLPFAIEIDEHTTRIADARYDEGIVFLQSLGTIATATAYFSAVDSEAMQQKQAQIIHSLATDLKIGSRQANVIIPDAVAYAQIVEMPILSEADLISAIKYQADEFIPMKVEDTYLDLEILKQDTKNNKLSILIVAAPKKTVDGIYKTIELAGFEPNRLETEVSAVGRLLSEVMKSRDLTEGYCVLNLGYSGSSIYVVDNVSKALVFNRSCKVGFNIIQREIMTNLNISEPEALELLLHPGQRRAEVVGAIITSLRELASEVGRIVDVYNHKYNLPVSHIFTINYTSYITDFARILSELSKYHVEPLPLKTIYAPNPVMKVFSSEITGFAAAVSATYL